MWYFNGWLDMLIMWIMTMWAHVISELKLEQKNFSSNIMAKYYMYMYMYMMWQLINNVYFKGVVSQPISCLSLAQRFIIIIITVVKSSTLKVDKSNTIL